MLLSLIVSCMVSTLIGCECSSSCDKLRIKLCIVLRGVMYVCTGSDIIVSVFCDRMYVTVKLTSERQTIYYIITVTQLLVRKALLDISYERGNNLIYCMYVCVCAFLAHTS
jgi:hypothetical protein